MPRDLSLSADDKLVVSHIPETKVLRVPGSQRTATVEAQVEVEQEQGGGVARRKPRSLPGRRWRSRLPATAPQARPTRVRLIETSLSLFCFQVF